MRKANLSFSRIGRHPAKPGCNELPSRVVTLLRVLRYNCPESGIHFSPWSTQTYSMPFLRLPSEFPVRLIL